MALKFGLHTRPQHMALEEWQRVWRRADEAGFYWVSVSDRFYAMPLEERGSPCFEGVSALTALALATNKVRVGCLMFCSAYRNPGLLAKAAVTVDHISHGRLELGVGAGSGEKQFRDFGYRFPPLKERMDQLEEYLQIVRSLLSEPVTNFSGKYYRMEGAVCSPKPVNPNLRIWVGGTGPKRTPRLAARYADGLNVPFLSPEEFRERVETLDRYCETEGRDPGSILRSVNLSFYMGADQASAERHRKQFEQAEIRRAGYLVGTPPEVVDRIEDYQRAGADIVNIAARTVDWEAFEAFIEEVLPHFRD